MFLSITISAKIGKDYDCRRIGSIQMSDGTFKIDFPRDMDMTQPFFMICEPDLVERSENWGGFKVYKDPQPNADEQEVDVGDMGNEDGSDYFKHPPLVRIDPNADNQVVDGFGERPLSQDISEIKGDPALKRHTEKLLEKEAKRYVPRYEDPADEAMRQIIKKDKEKDNGI